MCKICKTINFHQVFQEVKDFIAKRKVVGEYDKLIADLGTVEDMQQRQCK
jgi:hypothetical protein